MKRLALAAAILFVAACGGAKEEPAPAAETAAPAMTPAPADSAPMMDSTMSHDSAAADTTAH